MGNKLSSKKASVHQCNEPLAAKKLSQFDSEIIDSKILNSVFQFWSKFIVKSRQRQRLNAGITTIIQSLPGTKHKLSKIDWISEINTVLELLTNVNRNFSTIQCVLSVFSVFCDRFGIDESNLLQIWQQISQLFTVTLAQHLDIGMQYHFDLVAMYLIYLIMNGQSSPHCSQSQSMKLSLNLKSNTTETGVSSDELDSLLSDSFLHCSMKCAAHKYGINYLCQFLSNQCIPKEIIYFLQNYRAFIYVDDNVNCIKLGKLFTNEWLDTLVDNDIITINYANMIRKQWEQLSNNGGSIINNFEFHCLFESLFFGIFNWIDCRHLSAFKNEMCSHSVPLPIKRKFKLRAYDNNREDSIQL